MKYLSVSQVAKKWKLSEKCKQIFVQLLSLALKYLGIY